MRLLDDALAETKVRYLMESYRSQASRPWLTEDVLLAIMRFRGVDARAARYSEAFYCRKLVLATP